MTKGDFDVQKKVYGLLNVFSLLLLTDFENNRVILAVKHEEPVRARHAALSKGRKGSAARGHEVATLASDRTSSGHMKDECQ